MILLMFIKGRQQNWHYDNNYFDKIFGINKKNGTDDLQNVISCVLIVAAAMISNKKEGKKEWITLMAPISIGRLNAMRIGITNNLD